MWAGILVVVMAAILGVIRGGFPQMIRIAESEC
jgi:hypothetical protein